MSWTASVVKRVLPNGLTLLAQREPAARVLAVVTHIKAGYFDEPDEWVGIAHVLEHMFFKGTARRGPGQIARETQLLGGSLNASTMYDQTVYFTVLPAAEGGLERALDIQADGLMHATLAADELARELEVIIQEGNRKLDNPWAVTAETLYQLLFRVHRMRRWRIGTEAELRRLRADDVREYHVTRYRPDRIIVALVGDLDVERALELASQAYGPWSRPPVPIPPSPSEPEDRPAAFRLLSGDVVRPLAGIGWRTVGTLDPSTPALDVAAALLGRGRGSRLWREVRLPGLAAGVSASHYTPTEVGVLHVGLEADAGRLDHAVTRTLELAAELGARQPTDQEMERVRALFQAGWARRFESMDGRATALCEFEALGDYRLADTLYRQALEVSPGDVERAAAQYLPLDAACAVLYLPPGRHPTLSDGSWPPRVSPRASAAVPPVPARASGRGPAPSATARYGEVHLAEVEAADLLVCSKRGSGLVSLGVYLPDLRNRERGDTAGLSSLLVRSALRGAGGLSAEALAFAAEALGGSVGSFVGADTVGWSLTVPARAREAAVLLRTIALAPRLADDEVKVERALQAEDAARAADDMLRYPVQRALRHGFGDHPYGLPALGEAQVVDRFEGSEVRSLAEFARRLRPVTVAVGDLVTAELLRSVAPFAEWPSDPGTAAQLDPPAFRPGRGSERRDKAQTALALAFPAPDAASPDRFAIEVMAAILSGLAGRLFQALRERRSLAYTVSATPWLRRKAGAVLGYIATSPEREDEARSGMLEELDRVAGDRVPEAELDRARQYAAGLVEAGRQQGAAVAGEMVEAFVAGRLAELAELPERLRAVTSDDVLRVAAAVFQPERRAEYVVRGSGKAR